MKKTALYEHHLKCKANIVDFYGWQLPLHYGSSLTEHKQVRQDCGMFDVSHMGNVDVTGTDAQKFLRFLLANDVAKLKQSEKALYSCMLNHNAGILDDLIVYYLEENYYRLVINAAVCKEDLAWIKEQAQDYDVTIKLQENLVMIALQGPNALSKLKQSFLNSNYQKITELKAFSCLVTSDYLIARTGYTGEDGFEITLDVAKGIELWQQLLTAGVTPVGLAARDSLRLEAGFNLSGQDMNPEVSPLASNLNWTVSLKDAERDFIGKDSYVSLLENKGQSDMLVAVVLLDRGVLRTGQSLKDDKKNVGTITSGCYSPILERSIGLARVSQPLKDKYNVLIRKKEHKIAVVKLPFVKDGLASKFVTEIL